MFEDGNSKYQLTEQGYPEDTAEKEMWVKTSPFLDPEAFNSHQVTADYRTYQKCFAWVEIINCSLARESKSERINMTS